MSFRDSISNWLCDFEKEKVRTNIILPIYSVDLMLIYLRKQIDYYDVLKNPIDPNDKTNIEGMNNNNNLTTSISILQTMENNMRDKDNILKYYEKLMDLTKKALDRIDNLNNGKYKISDIYKKIYDNSAKIFIKK